MVASVPEFPKRHSGWPKRSARLSATTIESSVGCAKWVPRATRARTASTIAGWLCPASETPYPPWKSEYSLPSTSYSFEPSPWLSQTACGSATCQLEGAPPASRRARPAGGRAAGEPARPLGHGLAASLPLQEGVGLVRDQAVEAGRQLGGGL